MYVLFSDSQIFEAWTELNFASVGLAVSGNAPAIFKKTNRNGLPYPAILFCAMFALLAFMGINSGSGKVFGWFSAMTSVAGCVVSTQTYLLGLITI